MPAKEKIGQLLINKAFIDEAALAAALTQQVKSHEKLGTVLLDMGYITPSQLWEALAEQAGLETVRLESVTVETRALALVPPEVVSRHNVLPLYRENGDLTLAMTNPFDTQALQDVRLISNCRIRRVHARAGDMERAIRKYYGGNISRMLEDLAPEDKNTTAIDTETQEISADRLREMAREPSLINLVNLILLEATEAQASDIHIEPFEHEVRIKYRIDGVLVDKSRSPKKLQAAIISRVKIMANMNIAERFIPQDGHIDFDLADRKIDIRVSTVPSVYGESIVMRILDKSQSLISLEELGMNAETLRGYSGCLTRAHGIVLVTGPTGSGKTTTLYAALNKIYHPSLKIITIEDPVEYQLDGVIQMPVNVRRGLTFSRGLRHILRQDPNIIMVGEIRDRETAEIAIRAAMTGHLVFSTLHTNDAATAVTRLIDMGIEPFLLASSLQGVLAQRLVRKICSKCKEPYHADEGILRSLNNSISIGPSDPIFHGRGCENCNGTGLRGRIGVFELLRITEKLRKLIAERPTTEQILQAAPPDHVSMRHDGVAKILQGLTTPEEIIRVTHSIEDD